MTAPGRRLYRVLLRLLPRAFHQRHAEEIEDALAAESANGVHRGVLSRGRFWFAAMIDLFAGALAEWTHNLYRDGMQDMRYAGRALRRAPGFTFLAAGALALGMGANTAVFTLVNEVALRPLPVHEPQQLVNILVDQPGGNSFLGFSYPEYLDYRDRNRVLDGVAATTGTFLTVGEGGPAATGQLVSENYFDVLGIEPLRGRAFTHEEVRTAAPVAVVNHGFWQRQAGGSEGFVGSTLLLDGIPFTVIGVMPEGFSGIFIGFPSDISVPVTLMEQLRPGAELMSRQEQSLELFGRLQRGVTVAAADLALDALAADIESDFPAVNRDRRVHVYPLTGIDHSLQAGVTSFMAILLVLSSLVLLTACLNVGGLLLARGEYRRQEMAIRTAIGASRGRIVRQLVTETMALFAFGSVAALLLAVLVNSLLTRFVDSLPIPLGFDLHIDWRVLAFAGAVTLVTAVATGLLPALRTSQSRPGLGSGQRQTADSQKLRSVFLVAQVAVSLILLMSAGLFLRAVQAGQRLDPGFELDGLVAAGFGLPVDEYDGNAARAFYEQVIDGMRAADPTARVSASSMPPIGVAHSAFPIAIPGYDPPPGQTGVGVDTNAVTAGYFETVGIPLLEGRTFERHDEDAARGMDGRQLAVINREMAERFWPGRSPVGRVIMDGDTEIEILGVLENTRHVIQDSSPSPLMYFLAAQRPAHRMLVLARTSSELGALNEALQAQVSRLDDSLAPASFQPADNAISFFLLPQRAAGRLVGALGLLALLLAAAGVSGIVSFAVGCRRRGLGIRVALGGEPRRQVALVMRGSLLLVGLGIGVGALGVAALAPLLRSFLFEVRTFDMSVVVMATGTMLLAALIAAYVPARRVLKLDAIEVLRSD